MKSTRPPMTIRELAVHGLVLVAILVVLFPDVFLRGEVALPGGLLYEDVPWSHYVDDDVEIPPNRLTFDALNAFAKWYLLVRESLERGEWPLWNPYEFTGLPLMANLQSAVFYPPRLVQTVGDIFHATTVFMLLKLFLCGFNAYVAARLLKLTPALARFVSVGWMLSLYQLSWCYWPLPDVGAWFPIAFVGVEWLATGRRRKGFYALTLAATLILLAGHPESALSFNVGLGLYFVTRLAVERTSPTVFIQTCMLALSSWFVALLVNAVQLVPFTEYLANSFQMSELDRAGKGVLHHSLPLSSFTPLFVPRFYGMMADKNYWGFWNSNYVAFMYGGIVAWAAATLLFARGRLSTSRKRQLFAFLAPLAWSLVMTSNASVTQPIKNLPLLSSMFHAYNINFVLFALPLLGAFGLEHYLRSARRWSDLKALLWLLLPAVYVGGVFVTKTGAMRESDVLGYVVLQVGFALGFAALAIGAIALLRNRFRSAVLANAMVVLLFCDLAWAARDLLPTSPRKHIFADTRLFDWLQSLESTPRIGYMHAGVPPLFKVETIMGYDAITPVRFWSYFASREARPDALEPVSAVTHYLYRSSEVANVEMPNGLVHHKTMDGIEVFRNPNAFPRARLVGWLAVVEGKLGPTIMMQSEGFDPGRVAVTNDPPEGPIPQTVSDSLGNVRIRRHEPRRVTLDCEVLEHSVLVLADAFYPGWNAYVDGIRRESFPVYDAFRGIVVTPGDRVIEFRYEPLTFKVGMAVSIATLLAASGIAVRTLVRNRASGAGHAKTLE